MLRPCMVIFIGYMIGMCVDLRNRRAARQPDLIASKMAIFLRGSPWLSGTHLLKPTRHYRAIFFWHFLIGLFVSGLLKYSSN